jgi:glyoxylase-like metal-dependent hydrolase (beta-lactamase superfamily II)
LWQDVALHWQDSYGFPMPKFRIAIIPVTPFRQNCSLIFDEDSKRGAVVDPGGDVDTILSAISQAGISIEKILLTHGHIDHAGGATELKQKLNVLIEGPHRDDDWLLQALPQRGLDFGMNGARVVQSDRWLADGDTVEAAGFTFNVLHASGHSPGSVVFFNEANRFALMGDVLFRGSVGRTDLPRGDHDTLITSIRTKILPLGDDVSFLPGHGEPSTIGEERVSNPFLVNN